MTLLLITSLAFAENPPAVEIDFEEIEIKGELVKPSLTLVSETVRPVFIPGELIQMFIIDPQTRKVTAASPEEDISNFTIDLEGE